MSHSRIFCLNAKHTQTHTRIKVECFNWQIVKTLIKSWKKNRKKWSWKFFEWGQTPILIIKEKKLVFFGQTECGNFFRKWLSIIRNRVLTWQKLYRNPFNCKFEFVFVYYIPNLILLWPTKLCQLNTIWFH